MKERGELLVAINKISPPCRVLFQVRSLSARSCLTFAILCDDLVLGPGIFMATPRVLITCMQ